MSNENLLGRWSRLKRQGGRAPADTEAQETAPPDAPVPPPEAPQPAAETPADDLPDLDSITAGSDISAFLGERVPKALRAAALRRVWSLDHAIRDFRGPVEMDWDFNDPGSIPGFGAAAAPPAAGAIGSGSAVPAPAAAEPSPAASSAGAGDPAPETSIAQKIEEPVIASADPAPEGREDPGPHPAAASSDEEKPASPAPAAARRHGGATPTIT